MTMPLEIVTVPCLSDNYAYLVHDAEEGHTTLVDVPEAEPILAALSARGWTLDQVLITHHHTDHVQGLDEILEQHKARVVGAKADIHRLPNLDEQVEEGDTVTIGSETGTVIDVPGHTVGHIAYHFPDAGAVFTADSLMTLGCGRVFEGTKPQMWESLQKLAALPPDTKVYSGHEYTETNARFALTIDPDNQKLQERADKIKQMRSRNEPTVPSLLAEEKATNPFLRADDPAIATHLGMQGASPEEVFAEIRSRKDNY